MQRILTLSALLACLALPLPIHTASALPPTVDPTYGLVPAAQAPGAANSQAPAAPVPKWIWTSAAKNNQTIFARAAFSLERPPHSASLYVTADDLFEVYVNGRKVGATLSPTETLAWVSVQRFQVTAQLTTGRNVIAVRAVNRDGPAGLLVRLDADGSEILTSGEHWNILDDADPLMGWNLGAFDDASWAKATVVAPYGGGPWGTSLVNWPGAKEASYLTHLAIRPKSVRPVTAAGQFSGLESLAAGDTAQAKVTPAAGGSGPKPALIVDFGQELAGRLQVWGTEEAAITVNTGESREECDHAEPALDNSGPFNLKLAGSEPASTSYTAFRYAKLTFPAGTPIEITRIICDHKYYPVRYLGTFDCSDPLLTRAWYTGAYTAHLCTQEEIWDAPKRDRGLWIGDLQVTGETISDVFADRFLMEDSIEKVRDEAQHGRPVTQLPTADVNGLPGYSAAWFCTLADFHRHVGDQAFLARQHERMLFLLEYQRTEFDAQDRFINGTKWDFCDWVPDFTTDSPLARAATHLYIIRGLHEAVYLLRELGDTANADKYAAWADQLTAAACAQFTDPVTHIYSNRLQENVMAVLSDTATPEARGIISAQFLRADSPIWHQGTVMTPYYGYFVLEAMEKVGQSQDGLDLIRRYWGDMLRRGATTWWEMFDPSWPEDLNKTLNNIAYLSLSHGWSSGPTSFLTETVLGVRPTGAGYKTVEICPRLGDLTWAEGDVPTPGGLIHVRVDCQGETVTAAVKLPPDVAATIRLSGKSLQADRAGTYQITAAAEQKASPGAK